MSRRRLQRAATSRRSTISATASSTRSIPCSLPTNRAATSPRHEDAGFLYADPNNSTTLPPQTRRNIGDALDAKGIAWAWYAGAWNAALRDGRRPPAKMRAVIYAPEIAGGNPDFQAHHQPFNYYAALRSRRACGPTRRAPEGLRGSAGGCRGRPLTRGDLLQTSGESEPASRLCIGRRGRCAYRGSGGEAARRARSGGTC